MHKSAPLASCAEPVEKAHEPLDLHLNLLLPAGKASVPHVVHKVFWVKNLYKTFLRT
jgi:hypothetical protein